MKHNDKLINFDVVGGYILIYFKNYSSFNHLFYFKKLHLILQSTSSLIRHLH